MPNGARIILREQGQETSQRFSMKEIRIAKLLNCVIDYFANLFSFCHTVQRFVRNNFYCSFGMIGSKYAAAEIYTLELRKFLLPGLWLIFAIYECSRCTSVIQTCIAGSLPQLPIQSRFALVSNQLIKLIELISGNSHALETLAQIASRLFNPPTACY